MKEIEYKEILRRIGQFRNNANLSQRKLSLDLDYTEQFMKRIESEKVELKVSTLLKICSLLNIHPFELFYMGKEYSEEDKYFFELFCNLSNENKKVITDLMKKLK